LEPRDANWKELLLWVDINHDGESQKGEISTLDSRGIYALRVFAIPLSIRDRHGNWSWWWSEAYIMDEAGKSFSVPTVDVFFVHGDH